MPLLTRIKEQVVLITLLVVFAAIVGYAFMKIPLTEPQSTGRAIVGFVVVLTFSVLVSSIPAMAVIYGWYTGKTTIAVLIGVSPLPAVVIGGFIMVPGHNLVWSPVSGTIVFVTILSGICGLAGYCAAKRTKSCLAVAIALTGVWIFFWMNAFN